MSHHHKGFTLVELAVIMPMVILLIGGMIGVIIFLANSSLRSEGKSKLQVDVLAALDRMEQDVKTSLEIKNTGSATTDLTMTAFATNKDPLNPDRKLIRASDCTVATTAMTLAETLTYEVRYSVSANTLVRTVTMSGSCSTAWQKNGTQTLIQNVSPLTLGVTYPVTTTTQRSVASITLDTGKTVGGQQATFTGVMYARSNNIR